MRKPTPAQPHGRAPGEPAFDLHTAAGRDIPATPPPAASTGCPGTTLLYFYADWVGTCRTMKPLVDTLAGEGYAVVRLNVDKDQDLAHGLGVSSIPCFIVLERGIEVDRVNGGTTLARLRAALHRRAAVASPRPRPRLPSARPPN